MDIHDIAQGINTARGLGIIALGFALCKKTNKTPQETAAAKAFLQFFFSTLGIVLAFAVLLFVLTGYAMAPSSLAFQGAYSESRTGRIVENQQIRYVKNELYYVDCQSVAPWAKDLPIGTHMNLYFDEQGEIVSVSNADAIDKETQHKIYYVLAGMVAMVVVLIVFSIIAKKTFAKPWVAWIQAYNNSRHKQQAT